MHHWVMIIFIDNETLVGINGFFKISKVQDIWDKITVLL